MWLGTLTLEFLCAICMIATFLFIYFFFLYVFIVFVYGVLLCTWSFSSIYKRFGVCRWNFVNNFFLIMCIVWSFVCLGWRNFDSCFLSYWLGIVIWVISKDIFLIKYLFKYFVISPMSFPIVLWNAMIISISILLRSPISKVSLVFWIKILENVVYSFSISGGKLVICSAVFMLLINVFNLSWLYFHKQVKAE